MQGLVLLVAAAVAYWAWRENKLRALRFGDVAAVVAGLVGLKLASKGAPMGYVALAGAGAWVWLRMKQPEPDVMPLDEARALLDLPRGADGSAIREAHRRLIARVHPDVGGSEELARRINVARDTLLADTKLTRAASTRA